MIATPANIVREAAETAGYFAKAVHLFGLLRATSLFAALYSPFRAKGSLFSLRLPGYVAPFFLRSGTSDVPTLLQTIIDRQYGFHGFAQQNAIERRYEALIARGKRPLIIDCGANIGMSAVWFANNFPEARIFAVEPEPGNCAVLDKNVGYYALVTALHGGIWDRETTLEIADPTVAPWEYQIQETAHPEAGRAVTTYTMNGIRRLAPDSEGIFIAKIDIEGAEQQLFRSNTEWAAETDILIIELHDWMIPWEGSSNAFFRTLATLPRFDYFARKENIFIVRPLSSAQAAVAQTGGHRDYRRQAGR